ncbi:LysR family transcriptional regulator [Streptomyces sp. NPDC012935]|uniref:LysR family transcriptional regulator n=1 Tax=Streptomyces sp. NPDC012935 TaxID=3364857 RepID=UPI003683BCA4
MKGPAPDGSADADCVCRSPAVRAVALVVRRHDGDPMERRQLEYFTAVVEHGGFTAAANALHVAQPSLSHAIRTLERECGGKLFHRLAQGVCLTAAGEAPVRPARQVLRDLSRRPPGAGSARARRRPARHRCADDPVGRPLGDMLGRFRRAHPKVSVCVVDPQRGPTGFAKSGSPAYDLVKNTVKAWLG